MAIRDKTLDPFGILGETRPESLDSLLIKTGQPVQSRQISSEARPGDTCPECNCSLRVRDIYYECPRCDRVFEAADIEDVLPTSSSDKPGAKAMQGRLRVVGNKAGWFQPDLDRTNPGESSEIQKKSTYQELLRYNVAYKDRGGNAFPLDVLKDVAENYHVVQKMCVKRSQMKKQILAALVFHACFTRGFSRTKAEAAQLFQLRTNGISRGAVFLRSIDDGPGLDLDLNHDRLGPHITSAFAQLSLTGEKAARLRDAVTAVVKAANVNHIGHRSILRSKVVAATFEVLRRARAGVSVDEIATKCGIRKHTIHHFLKELEDYHSYFVEIYRVYGLESTKKITSK